MAGAVCYGWRAQKRAVGALPARQCTGEGGAASPLAALGDKLLGCGVAAAGGAGALRRRRRHLALLSWRCRALEVVIIAAGPLNNDFVSLHHTTAAPVIARWRCCWHRLAAGAGHRCLLGRGLGELAGLPLAEDWEHLLRCCCGLGPCCRSRRCCSLLAWGCGCLSRRLGCPGGSQISSHPLQLSCGLRLQHRRRGILPLAIGNQIGTGQAPDCRSVIHAAACSTPPPIHPPRPPTLAVSSFRSSRRRIVASSPASLACNACSADGAWGNQAFQQESKPCTQVGRQLAVEPASHSSPAASLPRQRPSHPHSAPQKDPWPGQTADRVMGCQSPPAPQTSAPAHPQSAAGWQAGRGMGMDAHRRVGQVAQPNKHPLRLLILSSSRAHIKVVPACTD